MLGGKPGTKPGACADTHTVIQKKQGSPATAKRDAGPRRLLVALEGGSSVFRQLAVLGRRMIKKDKAGVAAALFPAGCAQLFNNLEEKEGVSMCSRTMH